eukprot:tig00000157_g9669.t1
MTSALSYVTGFLKDINTATLSGAIDIIVIEQPDGSFRCTPFHVRFGKLKLLKAREKIVTISVNGKEAPFVMKLGSAGEAYFVEETDEPVPHSESASPIPTTSNLTEELKKQQAAVAAAEALLEPQPQISIRVQEEIDGGAGAGGVSVAAGAVVVDGVVVGGAAALAAPSPGAAAGGRTSSEPIPIHATPTPTQQPSPADSLAGSAAELSSVGAAAGGAAVSVSPADEAHRRLLGSPPVIAGLSPELGTPPPFSSPPDSPAKPAKPGQAESRTWWTWRWGGLPVKRVDPGPGPGPAPRTAPRSRPRPGRGRAGGAAPAEAEAEGAGGEAALAPLVEEGSPRIPDGDEEPDGLLASMSPPQGPLPAPPAPPPAAAAAGEETEGDGEGEEEEDELQFRIEMKPRTSASRRSASESDAYASPAAPAPAAPELLRPVPLRPASNAPSPARPPVSGSLGAALPAFSSSSSSSGSSSPPASPEQPPAPAPAPDAPSLPRLSPLPGPSPATAFTTAVPRRASRSSSPPASPSARSPAPSISSSSSSSAYNPAPRDPADKEPDGLTLSLCAHLLPPGAHAGTALSLLPEFEGTFEASRVEAERLAEDPGLASDPRLLCRIGDRCGPRLASVLVGLISTTPGSSPGASPPRWLSPRPRAPARRRRRRRRGQAGRLLRPLVALVVGPGRGAAPHAAAAAAAADAALSPRSDRVEPPSSTPASPRAPRRGAAPAAAAGEDGDGDDEEEDGPEEIPQAPAAAAEPAKAAAGARAERATYQRKSLRPSPGQLKALELRYGTNTIVFSVASKLQGTQRVESTMYVWPWRTKVIVSDVDGTITRSDVLGHILPIVGKDWSHSGVTALYTNIMENGYNMMYLTSRAIGQANTTRGYLQGLKQGGLALPPGPVIMSPDRLFESLTREVIRRKPEEFKIAALRDIRSLFPEDHNPFYAGFGNRPTDVVSYRAVGVPEGKIFIINASGEIRSYNKTYLATYASLNRLYNEMFPPLKRAVAEEDENFNEWSYWKTPLPALDVDEIEIETGRERPEARKGERPERAPGAAGAGPTSGAKGSKPAA